MNCEINIRGCAWDKQKQCRASERTLRVFYFISMCLLVILMPQFPIVCGFKVTTLTSKMKLDVGVNPSRFSKPLLSSVSVNTHAITQRREAMKKMLPIIPALAMATTHPGRSSAAFLPSRFTERDERRQLELCIVTVLRTQYWAMTLSQSLQSSLQIQDTKAARQLYIEARLGSKALLTGKIGAGANSNVYRLAPFQLRACLKDALTYCRDSQKIYSKNKNKSNDTFPLYICQARETENKAQDIIESFASCLEFDGLDNLQDASPRSSLMVSQYTNEKANFVLRMLLERSIPACSSFLDLIINSSLTSDPVELRRKCLDFMERNYASEFPSRNTLPSTLN